FPGLSTNLSDGWFNVLGTSKSVSVNGTSIYSMPNPDASHGTVMPITSEEYNNLLKAYDETVKPEVPEVLADFNFDAAPAEGEAFDGGNAKASGTYTLVDHGTGKALKLDGTSQFLNVTAKDGTSLLTGV
ncbi:hypothetical protein LI221_16925, partial [Faecalimonas umbilicata]|nr:hypothetical protein [Faecalimonas umbilicata]